MKRLGPVARGRRGAGRLVVRGKFWRASRTHAQMRIERLLIQSNGTYKRLGYCDTATAYVSTYADFVGLCMRMGLCDDTPLGHLTTAQVFVAHRDGKPWVQVRATDIMLDAPMQVAVRVSPAGSQQRILTFMVL